MGRESRRPGKPPRLELFRPLIKLGPQVDYGQILHDSDLKGPQSCTRVWVDDFNGDGKLDIFVGDTVTLISPVGNLTEADFKKKFADWNKSVAEAVSQMSSAAKDQKKKNEAMEHYQELYRRRNEFMTEDRTGFVWIYVRK